MINTITLNNGMTIPKIAYGCYNPVPEKVREGARKAIEAGFTYLDTASIYETEQYVAGAIRDAGVDRSSVQIATKAWTNEMGYEGIKEAFQRSLDKLESDYVDIYMIHWPKIKADDNEWQDRVLDSWRAMEELHKDGYIKGLGMSNFLPHHLNVVLRNMDVKPVVNQFECHPGYSQEATIRFCIENDIRPEAHSALGSGSMVNNAVVAKLVEKYNKTIPQICLRFLEQKGVIPVCRSMNMDHLRDNINIFDFEISEDDMWMLSCMPQDAAVDGHPDFSDNSMTSIFL